MDKSIELTQFADAIEEIVKEYSNEVLGVIETETREKGKVLVALVREGANVDTGEYRKAIRVTNTKDGRNIAGAIVHVRSPHYRLAHLLERPHALRGGGMSIPNPHWKPARDKIEKMYIRDLSKEIEGIK